MIDVNKYALFDAASGVQVSPDLMISATPDRLHSAGRYGEYAPSDLESYGEEYGAVEVYDPTSTYNVINSSSLPDYAYFGWSDVGEWVYLMNLRAVPVDVLDVAKAYSEPSSEAIEMINRYGVPPMVDAGVKSLSSPEPVEA